MMMFAEGPKQSSETMTIPHGPLAKQRRFFRTQSYDMKAVTSK